MSDWIETELKLGLADEHAWRRLRERLGRGRVVHQTNDFFDLPDRSFRAARVGVRLRQADDAHILTVKGGDGGAGEFEPASRVIKRRIELECPMTDDEFDRSRLVGLELGPWIAGWRRRVGSETEVQAFLDQLEALAGDQLLRPFGRFTNRRETCRMELSDADGPLEIDLEIDRTEYPGGRVDYEIEVEIEAEVNVDVEKPHERDGSRTVDTPLERTHRALVHWLKSELDIETFAVESKLARLNEILDA